MEANIQELIPISEHEGKKAVSARMLHAFLESKQQFTDWIKDRIQKYGLVENQDFEVFQNFMKNPSGGRPLTEYSLSIDAAKELSMVECNEKGKQARKYFIACEQKFKEVAKPLSQLEILQQSVNMLVQQEQRIAQVESKLNLLEAKTQTRPDYFTIVGYGALHHASVGLKLASSLGRKAAAICKARGIETERIPDPRFGEVKMYPANVLDEVFDQSLTTKGGAL